MKIEELAEKLGVPKTWLYERTRTADRTGFPVVKVGKYVRFQYSAVLEYLKTNGQGNR
ncbi:MAG TPA: helix-turn-helix domain-containing protein [Syntrophales bacterium]|nr:helix-turn-helix domain-containing protein [Syntrophales bacterium]